MISNKMIRTSGNWRYLLIVLGLLGLALVLKAGLIAFAGYVVFGSLFLSRFLADSWIQSLEIDRDCPREAREVGESIVVRVRVANRGLLPIIWVLVEELLPEQALVSRPAKLHVKGNRLRVLLLWPGQVKTLKYQLTFLYRGYYPLGPATAETGDVFGLYRRHRVFGSPNMVMVYPKVVPVAGYDFASRRPIGEVRLANHLFEDPTRTAGVRPYHLGDPLPRIHWRATARTGELHSRVYEPTSLAGASLLLDFHQESYPSRSEPFCSELAITIACSLGEAIMSMNQPVGLASNGRDAAERIRQFETPADTVAMASRSAVRERYELLERSDRLRPVVVETRRGFDQFQQIREALARLELTDGLHFAELILEVGARLPREATVIAILPGVSVETSVALGQLRRRGFAVSVILVGMDPEYEARPVAMGRLAAEGIRDVRCISSEAELAHLGDHNAVASPAEYSFSVDLA